MLVLQKQCVLLDLKSSTKDGVLKELADAAQSQCSNLEASFLAATLHEREALGSTGVGNGVAIPHGKIRGLEQIVLCFGRSRKGIVFDSVDNRPVQLFVLILSPEALAGEYLKTLAQVSRLLKDPKNRATLLETQKLETVVDLFAGAS